MLCAMPNDSATADVSISPSPQVAVIIARWANFCGSPAKDAALLQSSRTSVLGHAANGYDKRGFSE